MHFETPKSQELGADQVREVLGTDKFLFWLTASVSAAAILDNFSLHLREWATATHCAQLHGLLQPRTSLRLSVSDSRTSRL
jgi:hypothetical protein